MKRSLLLVLLMLICTAAAATERSAPLSFNLERDAITPLNQVEEITFEALDLEAIAQQDALRESGGGNIRFAFPHEVLLSTQRFGQWDESGDMSLWRLRVSADEATLLNFGFEDVNLPEGSQLFIYDPKAVGDTPVDTYRVIGPYGAEINANGGVFWTPNLYGEEAVIEVSVPTALRSQFNLTVQQVSHGYRGFGTKAPNYQQVIEGLTGEGKQSCESLGGGRSGACNQDVACLSEDDPWNLPRRSVGAYQVSGTDFCTGSLVNNTNNDQRMLFMTARHCIGPSDAPNVVIFWNYEWPTCRRPGAAGGTAVNPPDPNQSSSGTTFIANTVNPFGGGGCTDGTECSDMMLVEVNDEPDEAWNLYWSGWDRRPPPTICAQGPGNSTDGLCASIHHPGVDEKRITWVAQDMQIGSIAGSDNVHWHPFWHTNPPELPNMPPGGTLPPAVTEGGSSGSPLYSADRRLIGVLSGGPAFCGATGASLSDFYGGLFHGWEGLGTPTTRMRDHLDPAGTNPLFIDGSGDTGFSLSADPTTISQCSFNDVAINLDLVESGGFSDPVTLSATGLPGSASAGFSINPVTPPGTSVATISNLASAGTGSFTFNIEGSGGGLDRSVPISLVLSDAVPTGVAITSPLDQATGVSTLPTVSWTAATQGEDYLVEIATNPDFAGQIFSTTVQGTSLTLDDELEASTLYYARITPSNQCGVGAPSPVIQFTTEALPGDCPIDAEIQDLLDEGFDSGALPAGWSTADSSGAANWVVSTTEVHSGTHSMFAQNIDAVSDQRLTSPPIFLSLQPEALILTFETWQSVESSGTGCWDGGLLEITTDGGSTWTQVDAPDLEQRAYDGPIGADFDNPLEGLNAWCGDPRDAFERYVVDLGRWAGNTVQLRWRFGTDRTVGRVGMYVDSILVKSCSSVDPKEFIYNDRFEN